MLAADTLTKTFGARVAVDSLSFDVAAGEIFALVGPNGAGKTTTLRMLAGLIAPSSGTVRFRGEPMAGAAAARRDRPPHGSARLVGSPDRASEPARPRAPPWPVAAGTCGGHGHGSVRHR